MKSGQKVVAFKDIKHNRWTIWSEGKKTHLGYLQEFSLRDCVFFIDEEKRNKVRVTGKRLPHAWVEGTLQRRCIGKGFEVTYSPFVDQGFKSVGKVIKKAATVSFMSDMKVLAAAEL